MARSEEMIVGAGGRDLRVSNPGRVIFPATDRTAPVTKLDIVNYYLAVDDGIRRARSWTSSDIAGSRRHRAAAAFTSMCGSSRAGASPMSVTQRSHLVVSSSGASPVR